MKYSIVGAIIFLLLLSACSQDSIFEGIAQDSGHDAKIAQAKMDLDDAKYDEVISTLSSLYTTKALNPDVAQILASAYMGKAGVDQFTFIVNSTSSGLDPYDGMAFYISSPNVTVKNNGRYIDSSYLTDMLDNILMAENVLQVLSDKGKATDDDKIQLGIASAAHFILNVGNKTARAYSYTDTKTVDVPINTVALNPYGYSLVPALFVYNSATGTMASFQNDLMNINHALIAFSEAYPKSNHLRDVMNSFLYSALDVEPETTITDELILTYSSQGLCNYVKSFSN